MKQQIITAQDFFQRVVTPNVMVAKAQPEDLRHTINAIISLHQMDDWAFCDQDQHAEIGAYRKDVHGRRPGLKIVRNVATNAKHCHPRTTTQQDFGLSAMDAGNPRLTTIAKGAEGTSDLLQVIDEAFACWQDELKRMP